MSPQQGAVPEAFPQRTVAAFQSLPKAGRRAYVAIHAASNAGLYQGGQAALATILGRDLRSVKRAVALLLREGFLIERRRGPGRPAVLALHPSADLFVATERTRPAATRTAGAQLALVPPSVALEVASVRREDGSLFVAAPYVLDLMTPAERDACTIAVSAGADRLCDDALVSAALMELFQRQTAHERFRRAELARVALRLAVLDERERAA